MSEQHQDLVVGRSLTEVLSWALDMLDLYDERLATIDGADLVYSPTHVSAKKMARSVLEVSSAAYATEPKAVTEAAQFSAAVTAVTAEVARRQFEGQPFSVGEMVTVALNSARSAPRDEVANRVVVERRRQMAKGFDAAHDDTHIHGEILEGAIAKLFAANGDATEALANWPWKFNTKQPFNGTPSELLIEAAAMCVAEVERIERLRRSTKDSAR